MHGHPGVPIAHQGEQAGHASDPLGVGRFGKRLTAGRDLRVQHVALHSSTRFAWPYDKSGAEGPKPRPGGLLRALLVGHNLAYWFFLTPFFTSMSYETGFAIYSGILFVRFLGSSWINLRDFIP